MKALVTGGTGFLGSHVVRQLRRDGHEVVVLKRDTSRLDLLSDVSGLQFKVGDVTDIDSLHHAATAVDVIFHTAAVISLDPRDEGLMSKVNVTGTRNVVDVALSHDVRRLIHTSSMAAFGRPDVPQAETIDEDTPWQPSRFNSAYAVSKREAELEVYRGIGEGLDAVITNPAMIFGRGRAGENTTEIIEKVRERKIPLVPSGGTNVVDVDDVAAGHLLALSKGTTGSRYFMGSENLTWREIFNTIATVFGVKPPTRGVSPKVADVLGMVGSAVGKVARVRPVITRESARLTANRFTYSNRKAKEQLGCTFIPFEQSIQRVKDGQR